MIILITYSFFWCVLCLFQLWPSSRSARQALWNRLLFCLRGQSVRSGDSPAAIVTVLGLLIHCVTLVFVTVILAAIWGRWKDAAVAAVLATIDLCAIVVFRNGSNGCRRVVQYGGIAAWLAWPLVQLGMSGLAWVQIDQFLIWSLIGVLFSLFAGSAMTTRIGCLSQALGVGVCVLWRHYQWGSESSIFPTEKMTFSHILVVSIFSMALNWGSDNLPSIWTLPSVQQRPATSTGLQERIDELEELNAVLKEKAGCVSSLAHEVRTPLNALLACCTLLGDTVLTQEQQEYVTLMMTCGAQITNNIDYVLELARLEEKKVSLENKPFNVYDMCMNCVSMVKHLAEKKKLELKVECSPSFPAVCGDPNRLKQALINLLSNSIKFTDSGSVVLAATSALSDSSMDSARAGPNGDCAPTIQVHFEIRDTGIGISEEQEAKLFKPFGQAQDSTWGKFGGSGLGLLISQQLLMLMGGSIGLDRSRTAVGVGSCFVIDLDLPLAKPADLSEIALEVSEKELSGDEGVGGVSGASLSPTNAHFASTVPLRSDDGLSNLYNEPAAPNRISSNPSRTHPHPQLRFEAAGSGDARRTSDLRSPPRATMGGQTGFRITASASNIRGSTFPSVTLVPPSPLPSIPTLGPTFHKMVCPGSTESRLATGGGSNTSASNVSCASVLSVESSIHRFKDVFAHFAAMIVDDNHVSALVMTRLLRSMGFGTVLAASGGRDGLAKFAEHPHIHFILTDLSLRLQVKANPKGRLSIESLGSEEESFVLALQSVADARNERVPNG